MDNNEKNQQDNNTYVLNGVEYSHSDNQPMDNNQKDNDGYSQGGQQNTYNETKQFNSSDPSDYPGRNLGIAGLVLSLVSVALCFFAGTFALMAAFVGFGLSIAGRMQSKSSGIKNSMATAGMIISIIHIALRIIMAVLIIVFALILVFTMVSGDFPMDSFEEFFGEIDPEIYEQFGISGFEEFYSQSEVFPGYEL